MYLWIFRCRARFITANADNVNDLSAKIVEKEHNHGLAIKTKPHYRKL